ncbi:MAG: phosphatase PAP2 family protein [Actinomycetota bacterium]|nr:MAG: phosphatase PAP2 family protein [Actinomycetota bacterium]
MSPPVAVVLRRQLSPRLALAAGVAVVVAVPVTVLGYAATHGWGPIGDLDNGVAEGLHRWAIQTPTAVTVLQFASDVLHPWALRAYLGLVVVMLLLRGQVRLAWWAAITVLGGGVLDIILKEAVQRARPILPEAVASAGGYSFPSGHALSITVAVGVLLLLGFPLLQPGGRRVAVVVGAVLIALICFARVGLGVHYVSDVVAGVLIGVGWLAATSIAFESWRRSVGRAPHDPLTEGIDPAGTLAAARGDVTEAHTP